MSLYASGSQTVGPYLHIGLTWLNTARIAGAGAKGERDPKTQDGEGDGADQRRRGERVPGSERSAPERAKGEDWIVPAERESKREHHEPDDQRDHRSEKRGARKGFHR